MLGEDTKVEGKKTALQVPFWTTEIKIIHTLDSRFKMERLAMEAITREPQHPPAAALLSLRVQVSLSCSCPAACQELALSLRP